MMFSLQEDWPRPFRPVYATPWLVPRRPSDSRLTDGSVTALVILFVAICLTIACPADVSAAPPRGKVAHSDPADSPKDDASSSSDPVEEDGGPAEKKPEGDGGGEAPESGKGAPANRVIEDGGKESVSFNGQTMSVNEFRTRCRHVDLSNFCDTKPNEPVFIEARVGQLVGSTRTLSLWFPYGESPLIVDVPVDQLSTKTRRAVKENQWILAHGWFTKPAPGGRIDVKDDDDGLLVRSVRRGPGSLDSDKHRREFYVAGVGKAAAAVPKKLTASVTNPRAGMTVDIFDDLEVSVHVANGGDKLVMGLTAEVVLIGSDASKSVVDKKRLYFGRLPPGQTASRNVTLHNERGDSFVPKVAVKIVHAVRE